MALWMRRLGTGTGFAVAKLSEVLPRSERSLATVRMTDWASAARFGQDDGKERVRPPRVRGNLTPNPFPWGKGNNGAGIGFLDAEIRNRYRLR